MLLSIYASYHWVGKKNYVRNLSVFILLMSFSCAFLPVDIIIMLTFPVTLFSFPFYSYVYPIFFEDLEWVRFVRIRLLTIDLTTPLSYDLGRRFAFPLFLSVNIIGALLGYMAGRIPRIREWGNSKTWSLIGFVFGFALVGVGKYWLGSVPHRTEGVAMFFFGIIVLAIVIGKFLWPIWIQKRL